MRRLRNESGFTIVEVMVATAILLTGVLGTLAMMNTANQRTRTASDRQAATSLARDVLEAVRALTYRQVAPGTEMVRTLQAADGLRGNASPGGWEITRGGTVFGVRTNVCSLDDPADGTGPHSSAAFCSDAASAGSLDGNPADYKRVTVTVSWSNGSGSGQVEQATLVTSRGGSDAPAVTALTMTSPSSTPITSPSTTSASFSLETSVEPDSVVWLVDGEQQGVAFGSDTEFTFRWTLPALDGSYEVKAQAYDAAALSGEAKSLTVVLNRYPPSAPTGVNAGRNGRVVEIEWAANPERDITGYNVYRRLGGGGSVLACSTTTTTSCIDGTPPSNTSSTLTYWVVALDRSPAGASREGSASAGVNVNISNHAPNPPDNLILGLDSGGDPLLTWDAPSEADPDGDSIAFYRIYRGGTTVGNRYDRTGSGRDMTFLDAKPTEGAEYWITAVDEHLHESVLVGPVSVAAPGPKPEPEPEPGGGA